MKKQILLTATAISLAISSSLALAAPVELIVEETTTQVRKAKVNFGNALFRAKGSNKSIEADPVFDAMKNDLTMTNIRALDVNTDMLQSSTPKMTVNVAPGITFEAKQTSSYWLDSDYQVWAGELDGLGKIRVNGKVINPNTVLFVRNGDRIFGEIKIEDQLFSIRTAANGNHIIAEIDMSAVPTGDDTPLKEGSISLQGVNQNFSGLPSSNAVSNSVEINATSASSTIRVLQSASPQAISALGGGAATVDRMNFFLAQANQVYALNGLPITLQDAGKFNTGQNERAFMDTNLNGLENPNDGFMDVFAGSLRNDRTADIVTVMTRTQSSTFGVGLCGIAAGIAASANEGFFAISTSTGCATGYTFVHELAHLFGARHDNDPTTSPFAFGHGFVNAGANIRTVMAVNGNPQPRVGIFSTDDQTFNGASVGNSTVADNERVHATRRETMASFR
jgi:hypothetical protein